MAKRRGNGEGSIRKRKDGRWEGRYVAGHDANGKSIRRNVLGKTQAETRAKLKLAIEASKTLDVAKAEEYTVEKWVRTWYALHSKPNIREKTQKYYETFINRHIIPMLGSIKLEKHTGRDIQKMYNEVREHGRIRAVQKDSNPGMSASYVRGLHMMMHNCLNRAVKEHLILHNPTEDCIPPKVTKKEMKVLKVENIGAYLKAAEEYEVDLLVAEHEKHPESPYLFTSPITGDMYHPDTALRTSIRKYSSARGWSISACTISDTRMPP